MEIRPERPGDAAVIGEVTSAAFAAMPFSRQTEAAIVAALREAGALTLSLVAVEGGEVVGHVAFSPVTIGAEGRGWFALGPVSVRPGRQRRGIGQALIREGLARLERAGAKGCVLVGDPAYYGRFGFEADPRLRMEGVPPQYVQRLVFAGDAPEGRIIHHPGFEAT